MKSIRTFMAIEIPEKIVLAIKKIQDDLKTHDFNIKWVKPENIHLTIKFLGDIDSSEMDSVSSFARNVVNAYGPVSLFAKGIGTFPNLKRPRVVWVGISGETDVLRHMKNDLDDALGTIGLPKENNAFKGHLTLGRIRKDIDGIKFADIIGEYQGFQSEPFQADSLVFFRSDLKPAGPVYTKLERFYFKR